MMNNQKTEQWLGEVPQGWNLIAGRWILSENKRSNIGMKETTVLSLSYGKIVIKPEEKLTGLVPASFETYQIVEKDDIIIRCTDLQNDKTSLRTAISEHKGIITNAYLNLKVGENCSPKYIHYLLYSLDTSKMIYQLGSGLRQSLSYSDFKNLLLPIPPLATQHAIVRFLDDKTAKIARAITLIDHQIKSLQSYRQILIQDAVLGRLDPKTARPRPTQANSDRTDWIGDIPSGWEVKKLKNVAKINQHVLDENTSKNLEIDYVDIGSVSFENGIERTEKFLFGNAPSRARRLAKSGDTIISTVRTYLKAITKIDEHFEHCVFSTGFAVVTPNSEVEDDFLAYFAKSDAFTLQVTLNSKGMSYPAINSTDLANLFVAIPPLPTQHAIVRFLDDKTAQIDHAIRTKTAQIAQLKTYQTVLINDAVLGRMAV